MVARDWSRAFRRASFRGVPFWVDEESAAGGRRVSVTNIAYGEMPVTEDMGARERRWEVYAYCAGGIADVEAVVFTSALHAPGESILVLPMLPATLARVADFSRERSKDRNGYVAFSVTFVAAGHTSAPGSDAVAYTAASVDSDVKGGGEVIGDALTEAVP